MKSLGIDLSLFKRAGARRVRRAEDIIGDVNANVDLFMALAKSGKLPPIGGGSQTYWQGTVNTAAFAATPGTVLAPSQIPSGEDPLTLAVAFIFPILWTAAANGVSTAYNAGALIAPGSAATGSTVYPTQATYATTTAVQSGVTVCNAVPVAALGVNNYIVGIGGAAAVANNQSFFGILGLS